ncbi:AaceriAFR128Wp [[Ashbya] aceris (nom. inval.)]|nr:AaceriAFR128Wp [[Ashbya] aceris (nom. inval.)]
MDSSCLTFLESRVEGPKMNRRIDLTSTFWSEDYLTGIDWLLHNIQSDISELVQFADLYDKFQETWTYAAKQVAKVSSGDALEGYTKVKSYGKGTEMVARVYRNQTRQLERLTEKLRTTSLAAVEDPIKNLLFQYREFQTDVESALKLDHGKVKRQMDALRSMHRQIKKKAAAIATLDPEDEEDLQSMETVVERQFPTSLGTSLKFSSEAEWEEYLSRLKNDVPITKRKWVIPGLPNEYFSGGDLYHSLKRLDAKMDTSLFNLENVGQQLLDFGVLRSYNDVLHRPGYKFTHQGFYCWVPDAPTPIGSMSPASSSGKILQDIWKRVSSGGAVEEDTTYAALEISQLNEQFVKQWFLWENEKLKLEVDLFYFMKKFAKLSKQKFQTMVEVDKSIVANFQQEWNIDGKASTVDADEAWYEVYSKNHGTIGFYTPHAGLHFEMYTLQGTPVSQPWLFGTPLQDMPVLDNEQPVVLQKLLEKAQSLDPDIVAKEWAAPLDLVGISNMKRDCLNEYLLDCDHAAIMDKVLEKWTLGPNIIQLLRAWLLELPDSVVPFTLIGSFKEGGLDWLDLCPSSNLQCIAALAAHFSWLGPERLAVLFEQEPSPQPFPISHHFVRARVRAPLDCLLFDANLHRFFLDDDFAASCARAARASPSARTGRPPKNHLTVADSYEFVPRPFRTSSCEPSPTRNKRLSGLTILHPTSG